MKTGKIPDVVVIKSGPYKGSFQKKRGSRNDDSLFCWFDSQKRENFPHVSLNIDDLHQEWTDFHVTYSVLKQDAWGDDLMVARYHVRMTIRDDTVTMSGHDETRNWRRAPVQDRIVTMEFADMNRQALIFAKEFYSAAFFQMVD